VINLLTITRGVLVALVAGYVAALVGLYFFQRTLLYQPSGGRVAPVDAGLAAAQELTIDTPDREQLIAWFVKAKPGHPTFLYFHGNGANLANRVVRFQMFADEGWGVFAMSYRSFSGSTGQPTEANNVADALLAYDVLTKSGVGPEKIIAYGESLGTGIAVQVAGQRQVAGLVLDAPYDSMAAVAQAHYPMFPVSLMIQDRYESERHIANVRVPILIMHGELDAVIPIAHGKALAAAAPEPKTLVIFPNGRHENLPQVGGVVAVRTWLANTVARAGSGAAFPK
jgi:uncharacterized protein